jgi:acetylglutamate kinase
VTASAPAEKAAVLVEALPYIRRFSGRTVVVKYGGNAISGTDDLALFAEDIVLMRAVGMRPVVVHGGGPQITDLMHRLGKVPEFRGGLRVTDAETVDIARMVLRGQVNPQVVSAINVHGPLAVGVSGEDASLLEATARHPDLGFVGDVTRVNPSILKRLINEDLVPVVATVAADASGQAYNINADTVAGAIAEALLAEKLVYLTDVEGLRRDVDDPGSLIRQTTADELDALLADGTLSGGMIPKITSCVHAVRNGVQRAHILDGRVPHVLLLEIFTDSGIGTMVMGER